MNAKRIAWGVACLFLGSPALAGILVIDDDGGPGVDFTDIPPAVAAAQPGDTLLVHAGSYSAFAIDGKPLSLLGLDPGQVLVSGTSSVVNLQLGLATALTDLDLAKLNVAGCWGTVVLDGVDLKAGGSALAVSSSFDVRGIGLNVPGGVSQSYFPPTTCTASSSRFELTGSLVTGAAGFGFDDCDGGTGWSGGMALSVEGASKLHLAGSSVIGGSAASLGNSWCCMLFCACYPGNGASGLAVGGTSLALAMGNSDDSLVGGAAGTWCGGTGAWGCAVVGGPAYVSGVTVAGCSSATVVSPRDPWLDRVFTPVAGEPIRFNVHGEPGDRVTLYLGRKPLVVPLSGVQVEMLTSEERAYDLGIIGAPGFATKSFVVPEFLPQGLAFYAQARVMRSGQELRTNSTPIVVR